MTDYYKKDIFWFSDFDKTFLESKRKAEEALRTVDAIEEMVRNAHAKTGEAIQAMQVNTHCVRRSGVALKLAHNCFLLNFFILFTRFVTGC